MSKSIFYYCNPIENMKSDVKEFLDNIKPNNKRSKEQYLLSQPKSKRICMWN